MQRLSMRPATHLILYILFILFGCLMQFIVLGYEDINDNLRHEIDKMIQMCEEKELEPMPDLNERYYED